jgi:hypothetical protein
MENYQLFHNEVFGFLKSHIDAHTLGVMSVANLVKDCGFKSLIAPVEISKVLIEIRKLNNISKLKKWIFDNGITRLGFSYRLDPKEGKDYFCNIYNQLKDNLMFEKDGGPLRGFFFAGLPDACDLIRFELGDKILLFPGGETPTETLTMLGIPKSKLPKYLEGDDFYDSMRWQFAKKVIESESFKTIQPQDHYGYSECGSYKDSYLKRLEYCKKHNSLPIIRAHVGPYSPNRLEAIKEFKSWTKKIAQSKLLDVLSIGTSQLTQSNFGEDWEGQSNGGGVPINSELEYRQIAEIASPMLVRTYA